MSRTRSPNYPALDLGTAIEAVAPVFAKEKRNKMPRIVLASHLGYSSLNGRALGVIGALRAYGLLEGTGDDIRVSDDAIVLLSAPDDSDERAAALARCAVTPPLFRDLQTRFETMPSEAVLKYTLVKQGFTPEAAGKAVETYLATMTLAGPALTPYNPASVSQETPAMSVQAEPSRAVHAPRPASGFFGGGVPMQAYEVVSDDALSKKGMRKEIITLDDGDVVIHFPENLSAESFEDLEAHLKLFVKKMQRRATAARPAQSESVEDEEPDDEGDFR